MKNQKGISLIKVLILAVIIIGVIIFIVTNNQGGRTVKIEWGYMPSSEYYELRLAATTSEVSGSGKGTLSLASFNTLGRNVKNAGGKWFKNSNVNFTASISDLEGTEITSLTDGKNTAIFMFTEGSNYVYYTFTNEDHTGYKITIK